MANAPSTRANRALRSRALAALATAAVLVSAPTIAQAATRSGVGHTSTPIAHSTSICNKVSAATISSLVGYKVPAGVESTFAIKPTAANFHISGTNTVCTYGAETSMAALLKDVSLTYEVTSKAITSAELEQSIAKVEKTAKFKFSTYSGAGIKGFYFSLSEAGIEGQGITGVQDGTHFFGASVESKTISKSTLAALAKLAQQLS